MTPSPQTTEGLGATPLTAEAVERALTRIDREESIAYGKISALLSPAQHVAVMNALMPMSEAISEALQLDFAALDAARLSVPSEALAGLTAIANRIDTFCDADCEVGPDGRRTFRNNAFEDEECFDSIHVAADDVRRILAALPNREEAPEPCVSCDEPSHDIDYHDHHHHPLDKTTYIGAAHRVVREDAPSREGLDR